MSLEGPAQLPSPYDRIVAKTQQQHQLLSVHWELTYGCNERCSHCYLDVFPPNTHIPGELTTEECLRVIDELASARVLNLTFSGGEIFTRHDFFEIAEYAHTKRFLLRLFTNGILIKPAMADRIAALHPYAVEISIYSCNPELHEKITRVPRSFELSTRALHLLRERGVRTVLKTPLMHENVREFDALKSMAKESGAQFRYDITITPKDTGGLSPLQHRLTYDDLLWLFRREMSTEPWLGRVITSEQPTCAIGSNALVLDPFGNIFPCVQTRIRAGNIRQQSLQEIWTHSPVWKEFGYLTINKLPECKVCDLLSLCVRCHGLARLESGDLYGAARVNCRQAMARRQVLIERGALPVEILLPAHLRAYSECDSKPSKQNVEMPADSFPLTALADSQYPLDATVGED